ncbi:MAG TPA: hypothetical protein VEL82_05065 [Thermoplasmata archaeon]|nr:hypothetical protein [Thermoplasmata archaeon]
MSPRWTALLYVLLALSTVPLLVGTTVPGFLFLIVPIFLVTVLVARGLDRRADAVPWAVPALLAVGGGIAVVSVLTGVLNGLSDEPYSTPAYAALGWNLYSHPVVFYYVQYGKTYLENSYDVYLPLLAFVQIPGVDYRWISLIAWAAMLYLLRGNGRALAGLAVPWVPLLAANGQNDFVPLFALTLALAFTGPLGRARWAAEVFALALKQLANVVVVLYHLARREYVRALAAVAITAAILAPFLYLDASGVWCHVIVGDPGSTCTSRPLSFFVFKRNYWLYPTWVAVVFYAPLLDLVRRLGSALRRPRSPRPAPGPRSDSPPGPR